MGSQAPRRASGHARGSDSRSNEADVCRSDRRTAPATMARPRDYRDWGARGPGRHGIPGRESGRRPGSAGRSAYGDRGASAACRKDPRLRTGEGACGSKALAPPIGRSCRDAPLRVAASRWRNRLPRRAVQGLNARLPEGNEEAGNPDPAALALQRAPTGARSRRIPVVCMAARGWATPGESDRSGEAGGTRLGIDATAPRPVVLRARIPVRIRVPGGSAQIRFTLSGFKP